MPKPWKSKVNPDIRSLFRIGYITTTVRAFHMIPWKVKEAALERHRLGDQGDISDEEAEASRKSGYVRSVYRHEGIKYVVETDPIYGCTGFRLASEEE